MTAPTVSSLRRAFSPQHQLALDLMGVGENAFSPYSGAGGMTEETCLAAARDGGDTSLDRLICTKRKYSAFFGGDLVAAAAAMRGLPPGSPAGSTGESLHGTFTFGPLPSMPLIALRRGSQANS